MLERAFAAEPRWTQDDKGLYVSAVNAQRIYDDRKWPNPLVIKITHALAAPGEKPP